LQKKFVVDCIDYDEDAHDDYTDDCEGNKNMLIAMLMIMTM
jgi:hypothetical protein